jgi:hypothetical protein
MAAWRIRKGENRDDVKEWTTKQLAQTGIANAAGVAAQLTTGTVFVRPVAVLGARLAMARGELARVLSRDLSKTKASALDLVERCVAEGLPLWGRGFAAEDARNS